MKNKFNIPIITLSNDDDRHFFYLERLNGNIIQKSVNVNYNNKGKDLIIYYRFIKNLNHRLIAFGIRILKY